MRKFKVLLDRAHGNNVAGKCSPDMSHIEWKWSNARCKNIFNKLSEAGFEVVNIVTEEFEPKDRLLRIDKNTGPLPTLLISLHNNAAGMGIDWMNARGFSVFTSKGQTKSDCYASILFALLKKEFPEIQSRQDLSDGDADWEANFNVLVRKPIACLVEWLFQDNRDDVKLLQNDNLNTRFENVVVAACLEFEQYFK